MGLRSDAALLPRPGIWAGRGSTPHPLPSWGGMEAVSRAPYRPSWRPGWSFQPHLTPLPPFYSPPLTLRTVVSPRTSSSNWSPCLWGPSRPFPRMEIADHAPPLLLVSSMAPSFLPLLQGCVLSSCLAPCWVDAALQWAHLPFTLPFTTPTLSRLGLTSISRALDHVC